MAEKDIKDNAEKLQKLYLQNLALKLREGKSLSVSEFEHLRLLSQGAAPEQPSQKTKPLNPRSPESFNDDEVGVPERLRFRRSYTLTERAIEARKKNAKKSTGPKTEKGKKTCARNAWKTGRYAQHYIRYKIKPCLSTCPHYPCELVKDNTTQPGGDCLDKAAVIQFYSAIMEAVENKQYKDFNNLAALTIAEQLHVMHLLMEDIQRDGTMLKRFKYDKEGNEIGYEVVPHPSLFALPKMIADIGITPNEMMITPKAIEKKEEDDEGIKSIADLMSSIGKNLQRTTKND
jgi:hypothetical protein